MGKIHVLLRKEEIDEAKMEGKVAVIIDVLMSTTTIAWMLEHGAANVIPVLDAEEGRQIARSMASNSYILLGEYDGKPIDGFEHAIDFDRLLRKIAGKTVIFSSTNGTVAMRRSQRAKALYTQALVNGEAVGARLRRDHAEDTIAIVCSGAGGRFNIEDFYGAGYLLHHIMAGRPDFGRLTDAARAALLFYEQDNRSDEKVLLDTALGQDLCRKGYEKEVYFAAKKSIFSVVPMLVPVTPRILSKPTLALVSE